MPYAVKLIHAGQSLSDQERAVAEEAFRDCLEFSLGGEDAVAPAYLAWQSARLPGAHASALRASAEELALIARWQTAEADATFFALKPFGPDLDDAYFEISV